MDDAWFMAGISWAVPIELHGVQIPIQSPLYFVQLIFCLHIHPKEKIRVASFSPWSVVDVSNVGDCLVTPKNRGSETPSGNETQQLVVQVGH